MYNPSVCLPCKKIDNKMKDMCNLSRALVDQGIEQGMKQGVEKEKMSL